MFAPVHFRFVILPTGAPSRMLYQSHRVQACIRISPHRRVVGNLREARVDRVVAERRDVGEDHPQRQRRQPRRPRAPQKRGDAVLAQVHCRARCLDGLDLRASGAQIETPWRPTCCFHALLSVSCLPQRGTRWCAGSARGSARSSDKSRERTLAGSGKRCAMAELCLLVKSLARAPSAACTTLPIASWTDRWPTASSAPTPPPLQARARRFRRLSLPTAQEGACRLAQLSGTGASPQPDSWA